MKLLHATNFKQALKQCQQHVEEQLKTQFDQYYSNNSNANESEVESPQLIDVMRYATLLGGKRLRPFLVYSVGELFGLETKILDTIAIALECIHCYSLIHDDLPAMDNDRLRRGKATCHIQFNEASAILAGDALQTMAFEILATGYLGSCHAQTRVQLIACLAKAAGANGLCLGQDLDLQSENKKITIEQLAFIHHHKTSVLIVAAIELATIVAEEQALSYKQCLLDFGYALGLAFQVQDDILDITSDSITLGKSQGSDLKLNKSTYPSLLGLEGAQRKAQQLQQQALVALNKIPINTDLLQQMAHYVIERAH